MNLESPNGEISPKDTVRPRTSSSCKGNSRKLAEPSTPTSGADQSVRRKRTASSSLVVDGKQLTHEEIREIMGKEGTPEGSASE